MTIQTILSTLVPLVSLVLFGFWMLRIFFGALGKIKQVRGEVSQVGQALEAVRFMRRGENTDQWLSDIYAAIVQKSYSTANPLIELINRVYAVRDMATPDLAGALGSVSEREVEKLDPPREVPGTLLLLGIMGTVLGMAIALASFGIGGIGSGNIDVGQILSSMFLAFLSTGLALFLSVILRARVEEATTEQAELLSDLDTYAFTQLAPVLFPRNLQALQNSFFNLLEEQRQTLSGSAEKTASLLDGVSASLEQMHNLIDKLESQANISTDAVTRAGQGIAQDLSSVRNELSTGVLQELKSVSEELGKQREGLRSTYESTLKRVEADKQTTTKQAETLQWRYAESQKQMEESNASLIRSLDNLVTTVSQQSAAQTDAILALKTQIGELSESFATSQEVYQQTFLERMREMIREQFNDLANNVGLRRRN